MHALPAPAAPPRPRLLIVGTGMAIGGLTVLIGSMLATYLQLRHAAGGTTADWLPKGVVVPEIAANIMLCGMFGASVVAEWARYSMANDDRAHTSLALGVLAVLGVAMLNAQVYVWIHMGMVVWQDPMSTLAYAVTGTWTAMLLGGIAFGVIAAFRSLGGRYSAARHDGLVSLALYWHFLTVAFAAVWYSIYVLK